MSTNDRRTRGNPARRQTPAFAALFLSVIAVIAISMAGASVAVAAGPPAATTTAATNLTAVSATLNATVFANKNNTTYFFQYGTTTGYGTQTANQGPVSGNAGKDVSADVGGLSPNTTYHFRVVATNSAGTSNGSDMTFTTPLTGGGGPPTPKNAVTIALTPTTVTFGRPVTISGQVSGPGNGGVQVTLEANPYPYSGPFKATAVTATTTATGAYSLTATPGVNTHYRVTVKTSPPVTSPEAAVTVRVKVAFRMSDSTPAAGQLVRFFGTVTPAHNGKLARIQKRLSNGAWRTVASATLVATTPANGIARSKFAKRVRIRASGTYRVRVNPADGDHAAGNSSPRRARVH